MHREPIRSLEHLEEIEPLLLGQLIRLEWGLTGVMTGICANVHTGPNSWGQIDLDRTAYVSTSGRTLYTVDSGYAVFVTTDLTAIDRERHAPATYFHDLR